MKIIYLVRHGQKIKEIGDPGLTQLGIEQAKLAGKFLSQFPINYIFSSPLKRTVETAIHISKILNLNHQIDDDLTERMNWSDPKISKDEFIQEWIESSNNRSYIPKFGDSSLITGSRIERLINKVPEESHILLVSHGGAIVDYLRNVFGDHKLNKLRSQFDYGMDYKMHNCSINCVTLDANSKINLLNYTKHLEKK
ncbi:MAG: histidine phosphatase family protein [Pseudomonadales bacterium]|nr:histidine phosphatase family protein [Pseudomonadales bacterium]